MVVMSRMLGWRADLAKLTDLNRRIVAVIGLAIVIVMCGLGVVVMAAADELARGGRLAASVTAFLAVFLGYRAAVQWLVYGPLWSSSRRGKASHRALGILFSLQALAYATACVHAAFER
jgi:hypothetical protein